MLRPVPGEPEARKPMSAPDVSRFRTNPEADVDTISQLVLAQAKRLVRAGVDDLPAAIEETLGLISSALSADACQFVELAQSGEVICVHIAPRPGGWTVTPGPGSAAVEAWLSDRLAAGEVVAIPRAEQLPAESRRPGAGAVLGLPGTVGGSVTCALVVHSARAPRRWQPALVERLQLLVDMLGSAVQRIRREAQRSAIEVVEEQNSRLKADNAYLKEELHAHHDFDDIVGESAPLRVALARLAQVAPTSSTVLLVGPTGTGKELFALAVHERSRRHARPLVRVNCAALPPTLVESELFGHEKGAFTGAVSARQGRFELADGGTIFLDEIGDLAPEVQVKFLRVLQEGEFERVGSSRTRRVDVRVIAATHRNLEADVAEGRFRADLYYRLSVYPIRIPSLQERIEDIPRLVWFFLHRHQRELGRRITKVPDHLMDALKRHTWPGNVRELENVVERAMIATTGDTLELDGGLPFLARSGAAAPAPLTDNLDELQRAHIEAVLERCGGRINGAGNAAERLGVHPNTLRFRMKKLRVVSPVGRGRPSRAAE